MRKVVSFLLLFLLLVIAVGIFGFGLFNHGSGTDTSGEHLRRIEDGHETLLLESNQSARKLIEARKQLKRLQDELAKLKEQLAMLKAESNQAQSGLEKINSELKLASESYKKSVSEANRKIKSLEWQRGILAVVAGFLAVRR